MMSVEVQKKSGINWQPIIMAAAISFVGWLGTFAVMQYRQNAQADEIDKLETKSATNHTAITTLQANVTEVKNDVSDIKDDVKDIQSEQVAQGKLLERILAEVSDGRSERRPN